MVVDPAIFHAACGWIYERSQDFEVDPSKHHRIRLECAVRRLSMIQPQGAKQAHARARLLKRAERLLDDAQA